ncbi:MAG: hypothetical protein BGO69_03815 [Bacteroidetes bacterium 46-16]|nr:MAG: hypothetical protein BGO69_03815 [Bacteroidetes bacterium 46-16]
MEDKTTREIADALQRDWELQLPESLSEEAILAHLANRIVSLIESGPEAFFQLMYRLDISEKKLNGVLEEEDVAHKIARLVYDRQLQKIRSRQLFRDTNPAKEDEDLSW